VRPLDKWGLLAATVSLEALPGILNSDGLAEPCPELRGGHHPAGPADRYPLVRTRPFHFGFGGKSHSSGSRPPIEHKGER
jgi:hypothetical protein